VICSEMIQMSITVKFGEESYSFKPNTQLLTIEAFFQKQGVSIVLRDSSGYVVTDESPQGGEYTACRFTYLLLHNPCFALSAYISYSRCPAPLSIVPLRHLLQRSARLEYRLVRDKSMLVCCACLVCPFLSYSRV
jgi:hypothetical protein